MKKSGSLGVIAAIALVGFLGSCVSLKDKTITARERLETLGSVTVEFVSYQFLHIPNKASIKNKAYAELKRVAAREYGGNIDIRNIIISGSFSGWEALTVIGATLINGSIAWFSLDPVAAIISTVVTYGIGNTQKITATGDAVAYGADSRSRDLIEPYPPLKTGDIPLTYAAWISPCNDGFGLSCFTEPLGSPQAF
jgi:hypothetical protein